VQVRVGMDPVRVNVRRGDRRELVRFYSLLPKNRRIWMRRRPSGGVVLGLGGVGREDQ